MMRLSILAFAAALAFASCNKVDDDGIPETPAEIEGWAPIYAQSAPVKSAPARATQKAGKIYVKGRMLYQVETGAGIHVLDISTPTAPKKTGFIEIGGCTELSIQGSLLYANSLNDLLVVNISDLQNASEVGRVKDAFRLNITRPPGSGWSECIEPARGTVIGWERKTLHQPKCMF
jgi:hypothetical protein